MEVWIEIWKKVLVWKGNEMEENCQYGIWKNRLSFHSIPCPADNQARSQDLEKGGAILKE